MSFFGKLFGGNKEQAMPDQASMMELMKNPAMRALASQMQSRLTKEDQRELMRLLMARDPQKIQEFLKTRIPDFEEMVRNSGLDESQ